MKTLEQWHPAVSLCYFVCVIGLTCFLLHPICIGISLIGSLSFLLLRKGIPFTGKLLCYLLPAAAVAALLNPLFNHQGVTVLWYFPGGNPLTLESLIYGALAGGMLVAVACWCVCWQQVMTEDKLTCLFGRIAPALGLVFSITLRFVPRLLTQFQKVAEARQGLDQDLRRGRKRERLKAALAILSGVTGWALESAVDTADSMKARGYGLPGRTAFSIFYFDKRSTTALMICVVLAGVVLYGRLAGWLDFGCFPAIIGGGITAGKIPFLVAYLGLCSYPFIWELWEVSRWNSIKSKT